MAGAWAWPADETLAAGWMDSFDWTEELPWQPVADGEAPALIAAYRQARTVAEELHAVLVAVGVDRDELAELCPSLDADGRPVVVLGRVSTATAQHLCEVLGPPRAA